MCVFIYVQGPSRSAQVFIASRAWEPCLWRTDSPSVVADSVAVA